MTFTPPVTFAPAQQGFAANLNDTVEALGDYALARAGGVITTPAVDPPEHAFRVDVENPFYAGGRPRFTIEANQDTDLIDMTFHNGVVAIGHWDAASSIAGSLLALYQPSGATGNLIQVFRPGYQSQKVFYVGPQGDLHNVSVGLATKCFTIGADGAANKVFEIHQTGEIRIGPGGATATDVTLARSATETLKITGNLHVDGDFRMIKFAGAVGFFNATAVGKQTVSGSRGGNAALADLLTKLANYGLITDSTSA